MREKFRALRGDLNTNEKGREEEKRKMKERTKTFVQRRDEKEEEKMLYREEISIFSFTFVYKKDTA